MSVELESRPPNMYYHDPERGKGKAIAALVLGIIAIVLPVPFLDLACGIVGLVMAYKSKQEGYITGLRTAGFVLSIIGTVFAAFYTLFWTLAATLFTAGFGGMGGGMEWLL